MRKILMVTLGCFFFTLRLYAQDGVLFSGAKPSSDPSTSSGSTAGSGGITVEDYVQKVAQTAFENLVTQIVAQQVQTAQLDISQDEVRQIVFQTQAGVSEHPNIQVGLQTAYRKALQAVSLQKDQGAPSDVLEQTVQEVISNTYREFKMNELIDSVAQHFIQQISMTHQEMMMNQTMQMQAQQQQQQEMMQKMQAMQNAKQPQPQNQSQPASDPRSFHIP